MGADEDFPGGDAGEGVGEEGGPGHEPDDEESPEEGEGDGVVVAGDAEVEVAEEVLVDEVEPGPAVDVSLGGLGDLPVVVAEGEVAGGSLCGVGEADEDVPRGGDGEEDESAGDGVELAEAFDGAAYSSGEQEVEEDDCDGEDDSDEALGEDVEGAGGGEGVAEEAGGVCGKDVSAVRFGNAHLSDGETVAKMGHPALWWVGLLFGEVVGEEGEG